jgi:hypothetical protein
VSGSDSGSSACNTIAGVDFELLEIASASDVDYVLAIKDGCLVKVALSECEPDSSGGGSGSGGGPVPE